MRYVFSKFMIMNSLCLEFDMFLGKMLPRFSKLVALEQLKIIPLVLEGILCPNIRKFAIIIVIL